MTPDELADVTTRCPAIATDDVVVAQRDGGSSPSFPDGRLVFTHR
jgi:hypothetical protein